MNDTIIYMSQRQAAKELGFKAVKSLQEYIQKGVVQTNDKKQVDPIAARKAIDLFKKMGANEVGNITYAKAHAMKEEYQAKMAELDYKERVGELIKLKDVRDTTFIALRELRNALLNIPTRVSPILAHETNPHVCSKIIDDEIKIAFENFTNTLSKYIND